jgi:hypothetical protein
MDPRIQMPSLYNALVAIKLSRQLHSLLWVAFLT